MDKFDCYELCVQSPAHVVRLLERAHGGFPLRLVEDFSGTAAVSRAWTGSDPRRTATAVDIDLECVERGRECARREGLDERLVFRLRDAVGAGESEAMESCDVVFVGNFSIGYVHSRRSLIEYFTRCRAKLERSGAGHGVLACDTYGGAAAWQAGGFERRCNTMGREVVRYAWARERADPLTGIVENSISFRVELDGQVVLEFPRAFSYRWRLWSIHELREAMLEAGFDASSVYMDLHESRAAPLNAVGNPGALGENWVVLVAARCVARR